MKRTKSKKANSRKNLWKTSQLTKILFISVIFFFAFLTLNYLIESAQKSNTFNIVIVGDSVVKLDCPRGKVLEKKLNSDSSLNSFKSENNISSFKVISVGSSGSDIRDSMSNLEARRSQVERVDLLFFLSGWNKHWYSSDYNPCVKLDCYDKIETGRFFLNLSKSENEILKRFGTDGFISWLNRDSHDCTNIFFENPGLFFREFDSFDFSI
ncbi:MAG TPA: hypothetical protein ENN46_03215 [Candidatus Woesearchaeota archaeon]|nr:hypothetical protein [Candidatus Woesearchaeota archaeon]